MTKSDGVSTWSYAYNKRNLLEEVGKDQQIIAQYGYDGGGLRIKKIEWIENLQEYQTKVYINSGLDVIYEKNPDTGQEASYVYGPSGKIAKKVNELIEYYHTDHIGSTRLITDESGNVVTDITYEPFGELVSEQEERYLYTGKEKDVSTGLYYYGARYYDPEIGRFLTRDTVKGSRDSPQTLNKYIYCLNNPMKYIDPTGNQTQDPQQAVEDVFAGLQNIDPETYEELQEKVENGTMTPLEALAVIIGLMGYTILWDESTDDYLSIKINDEKYTVQIVPDLKNERGDSLWGECNRDTKVISINFQRSGNVADMALIFCHEVSHAVLTGSGLSQKREHQISYSVAHSYISAYKILGFEFSFDYSTHVFSMVFSLDRRGFHLVPLPEILERWIPRIGYAIA